MRRFATKQQRILAWILQDGRCNSCGAKLMSFDMDHVIPFSKGGETCQSNLQALCRVCHISKSVAERSSTSLDRVSKEH